MADVATPTQSTAEAVRTLRILGRGSEVMAAEGFLRAEVYHGTEYLSRKIIAAVAAGDNVAVLLTELLTHQSADGGFGESPGFDGNALDTAFALEALFASNQSDTSSARYAVGYLLQKQRGDGSWSDSSGSADVYVTSLAARALYGFRTKFTAVPVAVANASVFLLARRGADGLWTDDVFTAQALLTLATTSVDVSFLGASRAAFESRRLTNQSWSNDVYITALALRALYTLDTKGTSSSSSGGLIAGYVFRAGSSEGLSGASVSVSSLPNTAAFTNADGYFILSGLPAGQLTLSVAKTGYAPASKAVTVYSGQMTNAGEVYLGQSTQYALLRGRVFDSQSQQPLSQVSILLSGASSVTAASSADGTFEITALAPGSYTVTFTKQGYSTVTGTLTASAGSIASAQQGLLKQGAFADETPATLSGRVVDGTVGGGISGVQVALDGMSAAVSGTDGSFAIANVPRGSHALTLNALGYGSANVSFVLPPGASGALGELTLFAAAGSEASTALTIVGTVMDGVDNRLLEGATITLGDSGPTITSDARGRFVLAGLSTLEFQLTISAAGHQTRTYSGVASGYGEVAGSFALPPDGGDPVATASVLTGYVRDSITAAPIADAVLSLAGTDFTATSSEDGSFVINGIRSLEFTLTVAAANYSQRSYALKLSQHGDYSLDASLVRRPGAIQDVFQIVTIAPLETATGASTVQRFAARVSNLTEAQQSATLIGEVVNTAGVTIATVIPYAIGTEAPSAEFAFDASETLDVIMPWNTAQFPPGTYRLILRAIAPTSVTYELPGGVVLAQNETLTSIIPSYAVKGQLGLSPPIVQAGAGEPVELSSLIINAGNVPLVGTSFTLSINDPTSGTLLYTAHASADMINVGNNATLNFGSWSPTRSGNLPISVHADDSTVLGTIGDVLYVGDKASGAFAINKSVVPLGTQQVNATVTLQGVDIRTGTATDPLFYAVKEAIRKGSLYVGPHAVQWKTMQGRPCLGCHTQTQSLIGLSEAQQKGAIDPSVTSAVPFLLNNIIGAQQSAGGLYLSNAPYWETMQTALGVWALSFTADTKRVFRTLYNASVRLLSLRSTSGTQTFWNFASCSDCEGWWSDAEAMNMAVVKGYSGLLDKAEELGGEQVDNFVLEDLQNIGVKNVMDFEEGPDGQMWYVDYAGILAVRNLATQTTRVVATGLPKNAYGIAVRPDGTAYVSSSNALTRVAPDGAKTTVISGSAYRGLIDVAIGPDGLLYVIDRDNNRVLRVTDGGGVTVLAVGGLINGPHGMTFDENGNLFVTTNRSENYRVLKIGIDGTVSIFADGLPQGPNWIRRTGGYFYVNTGRTQSDDYLNPPALYRIDDGGVAERIQIFNAPGQDGFNAIGILGGRLHIGNPSNNHIYRINTVPLATSNLATIQNLLPSVARYSLARYTDNNALTVKHAWRIILLGEIRKHTTDSALIAQIDTAISTAATVLRQRQRSDGGWSYRTDLTNSDPLATAFVGMALEYTNPSVNDPVIRNSIGYLLNTQMADGAWPSFSTTFDRSLLGPSSFVMAYMPTALQRLGGIDTDLNVTVPANITLTNASITPTSQTAGAQGSVAYQWSFQGVTANPRAVSFDLTLQSMGYQEARAVALEAFLGFKSSFTGDIVRSDLTIPVVRAVSDLALNVSTAQSSYDANTAVTVTSVVDNVGPAVSSGQVQLSIRAADGTPVANLGTTTFGPLATGAMISLPSTWNTGSLLAGTYEVYGQLLSGTGAVVGENKATFTIRHNGAVVTASVVSDKGTYEGWDQVQLTSRVRNTSANVIQPASIAELTVRSPQGEVLSFTTSPVSELAPGGLRDLGSRLALIDRATGVYGVELAIKDAFSHNTLATASGSFKVERKAIQGVVGSVNLGNTQVYRGESNLCTNTVRNLSGSALSNVAVTLTLVNLENGTVIDSSNQLLGFGPNASQVLFRNVATNPLPLGTYACLLSAAVEGESKQIGQAAFDVIAPPIRVTSTMQLGTHGRVLILVDPSASPTNASDPFGPAAAPDLNTQRAHIESVLQEKGWSYTIVDNATDFERQYNTAGYEVVVVYSEGVKIPEALQVQIVAAVSKGLGLIVAGNHDSRNGRLEAALGIHSLGKNLNASALKLLPSEVMGGGAEDFPVITPPNAVRLDSAVSIAEYQLLKPRANQKPEPAVTLNRYGLGKAIYVGFDLPLEGAAAGDDSLFGELWAKSLEFVHPDTLTPYGKRVVPVELTLTNLGIASAGRVVVTLPSGASVIDLGIGTAQPDGKVSFTFTLAQNEMITLPFWVRLPDIVGDVSINARVQVGTDGNFQDHSESEVVVRIEVRP